MGIDRYPLGSTSRIYYDLIDSGAGVPADPPGIALRRRIDNLWLKMDEPHLAFAPHTEPGVPDAVWVDTYSEGVMLEEDPTDEPGRYYFDFDQSLDQVEGSRLYVVKIVGATPSPFLVYKDLTFGPMAMVDEPDLCSVQGSIFSPRGEPISGIKVMATAIPVYTDTLGRAVEESVAEAYTNNLGSFDLPLIRGLVVRLEIDAIGYDRKVTIPLDQSSVLFTDL